MRKILLGMGYLFVLLCSVFLVLAGVVLATIDPYSDEDMSRVAICERSGDRAPECALPPESAEKVLDALLACDADFFRVLEEEKAVFGRAEIESRASNLMAPEEPRAAVVRFSKPVEAYGLHLIGYEQHTYRDKASRPVGYTWGFHAVEPPADVARAIEARHPDKEKFSQYHDVWRQGTTNTANHSFTVSSSRVDLPGAGMYCAVNGERVKAMGELVDIFDLFLSQSSGTKFAQKLGAFAESFEKTILGGIMPAK